jgi:hypothetical protein
VGFTPLSGHFAGALEPLTEAGVEPDEPDDEQAAVTNAIATSKDAFLMRLAAKAKGSVQFAFAVGNEFDDRLSGMQDHVASVGQVE